MSKIIYHKKCRRHPAVEKAKRMLTKIDKEFGGTFSDVYFSIKLTGINDLDRREVRNYVEDHLEKLKKRIDKQLLQNKKMVDGEWNDQYEEGFSISPLTEELQIAKLLNEVHSYIWNNYPEAELKKSEEFVFTKDNPAGKYYEALDFFKSNPVEGFNQEAFAVFEDGKERKLYPLTFSVHDLGDATSVYVSYQ